MNTSPNQDNQNDQMLRDLQQLADWFEYLDALYKDSDLITNDKNVY